MAHVPENDRINRPRVRPPATAAVPARVLVISVIALAIPIAAPFLIDGPISEYEPLLWLLALVPAFLLAYYKGWRGAAVAFGAGMAALVLVQIALALTGREWTPHPVLLAVLLVFIVVTIALGALTTALHRERDMVEQLALSDALTGIPNRRRVDQFLATELAAAQRGRQVAVVLFDLDRFKQFNDAHGHGAGDEALRLFARVLDSCTRGMNVSGRYGGEEFLSVLSEATEAEAALFANRVLETLSQRVSRDMPFTVSAGAAGCTPGRATAATIVAAADRALYAAKQRGGNLVRRASEIAGEGLEPSTSRL